MPRIQLQPATVKLYKRYLTARALNIEDLTDMMDEYRTDLNANRPPMKKLVLVDNNNWVLSTPVKPIDTDFRLKEGLVFEFEAKDPNFQSYYVNIDDFDRYVLTVKRLKSESIRCKSEGYGINWWVVDVACPIVNESAQEETTFNIDAVTSTGKKTPGDQRAYDWSTVLGSQGVKLTDYQKRVIGEVLDARAKSNVKDTKF